LAKCVKVFEIGFVQCVSNDFDVEVIEILGGKAVSEVWCWSSVQALVFDCPKNVPSGVSTKTLWYNSSMLVATHNAGIVSNTPNG
jgi:hypothetical protein